MPAPSAQSSSAGYLRLALRPFALLAYWMPVWIPLVVLGQIGIRGLRPALAEGRRLTACEGVLSAQLDATRTRRAELEALNAALADPIYRERLRLVRASD